ncbi:MAG: hypothetical protein JO170_30685 [Verrucomicrobia bacterium]|nr:hypothetical protein [Verrucomicrobiota bacterium]
MPPPALFWVASIVYHGVPGLDGVSAPQMPMLVGAGAIGVSFFVVSVPFAGLIGTWFSSVRIAKIERQIVKLQRNRNRIQRRRRASDEYNAR